MKIIKQENKTLKCSKCGTEFVLEPKDYVNKVHHGIVGFRETFLPGITEKVMGDYVYCPCCWEQVLL